MKSFCLAFVGVVSLVLALDAHATDESDFLGTLKKFGITTDERTSKKACLCSGGMFDDRVGVVTVQPDGAGWEYQCRLRTFLDDGTQLGYANCSGGGGSTTVLSK